MIRNYAYVRRLGLLAILLITSAPGCMQRVGSNTSAAILDPAAMSVVDGSVTPQKLDRRYVEIQTSGYVGIGTADPKGALHVAGDIVGTGRLALGNKGVLGYGAGPYEKIFDISHEITDFSGSTNWEPLRSHITLNPSYDLTGAYATAIYGAEFETLIPSSNSKNFYYIDGTYIGAFHEGSGTVSYLSGGGIGAWNGSSGTVAHQTGAYIYSAASSTASISDNMALSIWSGHQGTGGSITNDYSLHIRSPKNSQPITNHYGIYLESQEFGANSYSIYSAGGRNYLAGDLGVGTTDPQSRIHVSGYLQLDLTVGPPPAADCDSATKHGRMKVDASAGVSRLWICTADGWVSK